MEENSAFKVQHRIDLPFRHIRVKLAVPIYFDDYDIFKSPLLDFTKHGGGRCGKLRSLFGARRGGQFLVVWGGCRYECAAALIGS